MQYGQSRPFEPGRPIELTDAQLMEKADVALPRGSVLAGRVADEFGEAVAEAEVIAMRLQYQNGRRRLTPAGRNATTNDLGQFRIYGLPPGEYYIAALNGDTTIDLQDVKFLESVSRVATRITLSDGEKKTQNLDEKAIH